MSLMYVSFWPGHVEVFLMSVAEFDEADVSLSHKVAS